MNPAKIVVGKEQGDSRFVIAPQLAMAIGQRRETAYLHSQRLVTPLDKACGRPVQIGTTPAVEAGVTDHVWTVRELLERLST
jgi:hypothetical protein